ncbi:MAG: hypothetical protein KF819_05365 [Labilithrix sp.]|nr:hypothetical protein [Labilithrix sp.]
MDSPTISARPDIAVAETAPRVTPAPPRGVFKKVLASSLVRTAETAMRVLPGSPLMAVAIRGGAGPGPALGVPLGGPNVAGGGRLPEGPGALANAPGAGPLGAGLSPTGAATGSEAPAIESSLQQSQEMNLYYLQIQEAVNAQNRSFTALSNVLKAEHDTVKTAIGNIR